MPTYTVDVKPPKYSVTKVRMHCGPSLKPLVEDAMHAEGHTRQLHARRCHSAYNRKNAIAQECAFHLKQDHPEEKVFRL